MINVEELRGTSLYVFGASISGGQTFDFLLEKSMHHQICAFVDNNEAKQGGLYLGIRVISPSEMAKELENPSGPCAVIISSVFFDDIFAQLIGLNVPKQSFYIFLLYDPCSLKRSFEPLAFTEAALEELYDTSDPFTLRMLDLLLNRGFLNGRGLDRIGNYLGAGGVDRYFYDDIADHLTKGRCCLIDIGAYTGDSALQIKARLGRRLKKIFAFEPNAENFLQLEKNTVETPGFERFCMGLGEKRETLYFSSSGPFFKTDTQGETLVEVDSLDRLDLDCSGHIIVKIDIEGSEMSALRGAENFIVEKRPSVAVCVYHRRDDIFEIPAYLRKLVPEYKFYLRGGMHAVCYAFAEKTL